MKVKFTKNKKAFYVIKSILAVGISTLLIALTFRYAFKASPIFKILALTINALVIYISYLTIKNKPKNGE
jgi:hypothetical protein